METNPDILAARAKLRARMGAGTALGGAGSVRRTKKAAHKATGTDDKKLATCLKRLGCNVIQGIEEVNLFKDNGEVIHFENPKVQASIQANTYVISGNGETKKLQDLLPGIIQHLGQDSFKNIAQLAQSMGAGAGAPGAAGEVENADDEDIPDLVENFDEAE